MSLVLRISDLSWLQSLGYLNNPETVSEIWTKLQERCQDPLLEQENEAEQLRACIRHIQQVIIPKLKSDKTLIIDNHLCESSGLNVNVLPRLLDAVWRVEPNLPYPETALYVNTRPQADHLPFLKQVKHLSISTAPAESPDCELFSQIIDAVGETLESLRFNPVQHPSNLKELVRCPNLKKLSLISAQGITPDSFITDTYAPQISISELILEYGFPTFNEDQLIQLAAALPTLNLLSVKISNKDEEYFLKQFLQYFPNIALELSIWHDDPEFIETAAKYDLVSLSVTFGKMEDVKKLQQCSHLRQLYTAYLTDEGVSNLIASVRDLKSLRLYNCNISEESFQALAQHFSKLEFLEVIKGSFNDFAMLLFADSCPKLKKVVARECKQLARNIADLLPRNMDLQIL